MVYVVRVLRGALDFLRYNVSCFAVLHFTFWALAGSQIFLVELVWKNSILMRIQLFFLILNSQHSFVLNPA